MIDYDSFSHCHLTGHFVSPIHAGAKELNSCTLLKIKQNKNMLSKLSRFLRRTTLLLKTLSFNIRTA